MALAFLLQSTALAPAPLVGRPAVITPRGSVIADARASSRRELISSFVGAGVLSALPAATFAESTLVTRQAAYSRYVPRIERGRDYWAGGVRKAIANQDWNTILADLD